MIRSQRSLFGEQPPKEVREREREGEERERVRERREEREKALSLFFLLAVESTGGHHRCRSCCCSTHVKIKLWRSLSLSPAFSFSPKFSPALSTTSIHLIWGREGQKSIFGLRQREMKNESKRKGSENGRRMSSEIRAWESGERKREWERERRRERWEARDGDSKSES